VNNNKFIFRLFGIISILVSIGSAEIIDTAEPIELQSKPVLQKIGNVNQLSAVTVEYSNALPIDGVAIRFKCETEPSVLFKFMNTNGNWSDWQSSQIFKESNTDRWIASSIEQITKESIQYEVQITADRYSDIQLYEYGIFPHEDEIINHSISKIHLYPSEIPKPTIITRQEWGARAPNGNYDQTLINNKLTIHHAAGWPATNLQEGKQAVKEIQDFHIDGRGWTDIAYHFLVDDAGNIYQGRPETVQGAHTYQHNTGNIGLCVLGCYDPPYEVSAGIPCHQYLTQEARDAVVHLFAWVIETYGYDNADILKGHRDYYDYARTSCPGQNIHQLIPDLKYEIDEFIKFGGPPFDYSLLNNYPNPFNSTTNIEYGIPVDCEVTIKIYNTLGEEVTTIINNESQLKGTHTTKWSGKNNRDELVQSGIYYYQIQTEQNSNDDVKKHFTETGKMLFLK